MTSDDAARERDHFQEAVRQGRVSQGPDGSLVVADLTGLSSEQAYALGKAYGEIRAERDRLAERLDNAHDALTRITDADDDAFTTLESTVDYVVGAYRALAAAEEQATDEASRLRTELDRLLNDLARRGLVAEFTWRHNEFVADHTTSRDVAEAERRAVAARAANPGDDIAVVTRLAGQWRDVDPEGGTTHA